MNIICVSDLKPGLKLYDPNTFDGTIDIYTIKTIKEWPDCPVKDYRHKKTYIIELTENSDKYWGFDTATCIYKFGGVMGNKLSTYNKFEN